MRYLQNSGGPSVALQARGRRVFHFAENSSFSVSHTYLIAFCQLACAFTSCSMLSPLATLKKCFRDWMWERERSPVNSDDAFYTCSVLEFLYFLSLFWLAALSCAKTQQSHENFWPCHDLSSWIQVGDHLIITKTCANCRPHWLIHTHHLWKEVNLHLLLNPNSPINVSKIRYYMALNITSM